MALSIANNPAGEIEIGLYGEVAPKTVENFYALCNGDHGKTPEGTELSYKGSIFHRIVPKLLIHGTYMKYFNSLESIIRW